MHAQLNACKEFSKSNKYAIINTYVYEAKSSRSDARPFFQSMIKDSDEGGFDVIIVHKLLY
ncbi:MAG: recombinase family protein [Lachnospirales bacterium]